MEDCRGGGGGIGVGGGGEARMELEDVGQWDMGREGGRVY